MNNIMMPAKANHIPNTPLRGWLLLSPRPPPFQPPEPLPLPAPVRPVLAGGFAVLIVVSKTCYLVSCVAGSVCMT
jgi:hypothetical protein